MNRSWRILSLVLAVIVVSLVAAMPVMAYTYYAKISIQNPTTTAYTVLPCYFMVDNDWMAANSYATANLFDTRVQTYAGTAQKHMPVSDRTMFTTAVPASGQVNLLYTTGNAPLLAQYPIIPGYDYTTINLNNSGANGYFYNTDATVTEPSNNFTVTYDGYINTAANNYGVTPLWKQGSMVIYATVAGGNVGADRIGAIGATDTSAVAGASESVMGNTYWGQVWTAGSTYWVTSVSVTVNSAATTGYLYVGIRSVSGGLPTGEDWTEGYVSAVGLAGLTSISLDRPIRITNATSYVIVLRAPDVDAAVTWTRSAAGATNVRSLNAGSTWTAGTVTGTFDYRFYGCVPSNTVTAACATGEHSIVVRCTGGGGIFGIAVDGGAETSIGVVVMPNSAFDWKWMMGCPYANSVKYSAGGAAELWYEPVTYIDGTTLPDRQGAAVNGTFVFPGAQPTVVTAGSLLGYAATTTTGTEDVPTSNLPDVGVSDWFGDGTVAGTILTNPVRPFITMVSDNTTLTEIQVWRWLGFVLLVLVVVGVSRVVKGHQGITAIVASAAIIGLVAVDHNIYPLWLLVFAIGGFVGGIIAERSPSL